MKKSLFLSLFLSSVIGLVSCGSSSSSKTLNKPEVPQTKYDGVYSVKVLATKGCGEEFDFTVTIKNGDIVDAGEYQVFAIVDVQDASIDGSVTSLKKNYSFSGSFEPNLHGDWIDSENCRGLFITR